MKSPSALGRPAYDKRIEEKLLELAKLSPAIPAITIVHDLTSSSAIYMSPQGLKLLEVSLEDLVAMGPDYHARFFNMEFAQGYVPRILGMMESNKEDEMISYFQQVRSSPDKDWTWYLTCTRIFMRDAAGKPLLIISNAIPFDTGHYIDPSKAQRLLEENSFLRNHHHIFSTLTKREKEILRMMALGNNSGKMAKTLHISAATVTTHRRNIKRKLRIKTNYDITRFAQAFDLI